jgi:hypothetical protein
MSFVSTGGKFKLYTVLNGASANNCDGRFRGAVSWPVDLTLFLRVLLST